MSSLDQFTESFDSLRRAFSEQRLAHAYIIVGAPRGSGLIFAETLLKLIFCKGPEAPCNACPGCKRAGQHRHPDAYWLEPEKKSRVIGIGKHSPYEDGIRTSILDPLSRSAYEGGWKAGVLLAADRMTEQAANALLKTLEEPAARTLLLLVTDQPQALMPTILSRCQRVDLGGGDAIADAPWRAELMDILRRETGQGSVEKLVLAGRLKGLLDKIKAELEEQEDVPVDGRNAGQDGADEEDAEDELEAARAVVEARVQAKLIRERGEMLKTWALWQRDVLACRLGAPDDLLNFPGDAAVLRSRAMALTYGQALAQLRALDAIVRRLARNVPVMDYTRVTQHGAWSGKFSCNGVSYDLGQDTWWGSRDHSWGIRNVGGRDPRGAPPTEIPQFFWNWAPVNFDDMCTLFTVSEYADGTRWHQSGVILKPYPDASHEEVGVDHNLTFAKGTRWLDAGSTISLIPAKGKQLDLEFKPLYSFLMKGIGYGDPRWGHGMWVGPDEVDGGMYDLSLEPPMANLHVQQVSQVTAGRKKGIGIYEVIVMGPLAKYGFKDLMDPAK